MDKINRCKMIKEILGNIFIYIFSLKVGLIMHRNLLIAFNVSKILQDFHILKYEKIFCKSFFLKNSKIRKCKKTYFVDKLARFCATCRHGLSTVRDGRHGQSLTFSHNE